MRALDKRWSSDAIFRHYVKRSTAYDGWSKIWAQNSCVHCRLLHILCASYQSQCHLLLWCHSSWLKLCRERSGLSLGSCAWVWTSWLECARCVSWQSYAPWWKVLAHQSRIFRQATVHALFQPPNVVQMRTMANLFELCRVQLTFVKQNNDDLILAIQSAGVERGRNGSRKNKSTEKIQNQRRTCWSIAPMALMLSIRCILGVKSSRSMIFMGIFRWVGWDKKTLLFLS